jgi:hypothetical protein
MFWLISSGDDAVLREVWDSWLVWEPEVWDPWDDDWDPWDEDWELWDDCEPWDDWEVWGKRDARVHREMPARQRSRFMIARL